MAEELIIKTGTREEQYLELIPQIAGLLGAGRRIVLRIEVQHQLFAFVIRERYFFPVLIFSCKGRGLVSFLQVRHKNTIVVSSNG